MKKTLTSFIALSMLYGCSTTPRTYSDSQSEAYNIVRAGGLYEDIQDTEVPADQVGSVTESMLKVGFISSGFMKPQLGMTSFQTGGLHLLTELFEPDTHGERNSLMAWMPTSAAKTEEEAQTKLLDQINASMIAAFDELNIGHRLILRQEGFISMQFIKDEWNCPLSVKGRRTKLEDMCRVRIRVYEPDVELSPAYIAGAEEARYVFDAGHDYKFHWLNVVKSKNGQVPEDQVYTAISKKLPDWVYLYLAPGKVTKADGKPIKYPYVLHKGDTKFFVVAEKT